MTQFIYILNPIPHWGMHEFKTTESFTVEIYNVPVGFDENLIINFSNDNKPNWEPVKIVNIHPTDWVRHFGWGKSFITSTDFDIKF